MRQARHIAIAGGGLIGLACALTLRLRGLRVTVLEAGEATKEASWAAGGMLAAEDPENPAVLLPLSRYSRAVYGRFLQEVQEISRLPVALRTREAIQVLHMLRKTSAGRVLSREEALELVPGLNVSEGEQQYLLLDEASLDPRELCTAVRSAVAAAGVEVREDERVLSVEDNDKDDGVVLETARGAVRADAFINCCGAWAESLDASTGVAPLKGQMLVIAQPEGPRLTRVLRSPDVYLIPRGDGRIVIGATVEHAGYSKSVEASALALLRERAARLWPPAADAAEIDSWAGLRPGSPDGLPVVGQSQPESARRFVASGHFRNGILLAPGTAQAIADLVCGVKPAVDLAPFSPLRPSITRICDKHFAAAL